jgi:hypothetical protein
VHVGMQYDNIRCRSVYIVNALPSQEAIADTSEDTYVYVGHRALHKSSLPVSRQFAIQLLMGYKLWREMEARRRQTGSGGRVSTHSNEYSSCTPSGRVPDTCSVDSTLQRR